VQLLFEGGPWAGRLLDTEVATAPEFIAPDDDQPGAYRRVEQHPGTPIIVYEWLPDGAYTPRADDLLRADRPREVAPRVVLEMVGAVAALALALITSFRPAWIEDAFGVNPDGGSGAVEWVVVFALAAISVGLLFAAKRECRRLSLARAT
jgi:hypothetical protein